MTKIDTERFIVSMIQQLKDGHPLRVNILYALLNQGLIYTGDSILRTVNKKEEPSLEEAITNEPVVKRVTQILKESEDEKIRKALKQYFVNSFQNNGVAAICGVHIKDVLAWLEKQAEHKKFRDSIQVGDKVTKNEDGVLVNLSQLKRVAKKDEQILANSAKTCKDGQRSDMVEPKFKIGDWVVRNGKTLQISGIDTVLDGTFHYWFTKGTWLSSKKMENAILWSIQDAKDGDVLVTEDWVFIFKKMNSNGKPVCYCHYDIELGFRIDTNSYMASGSEIYPATKEQRDLLFQKMKEAGYTFDFEKGELKKIEQPKQEWCEKDKCMLNNVIDTLKPLSQTTHSGYSINSMIDWLKSLKDRVQPKPEWSEEDEEMYKKVETAIDSYYAPFSRDAEEMSEWFKNIKERVQLQPKQKWSYEDETVLNNLIYALANDRIDNNRDEYVDWLKSLRPKNTWKPSDEQMEALKTCVNGWQDNADGRLESLYNNLKALL